MSKREARPEAFIVLGAAAALCPGGPRRFRGRGDRRVCQSASAHLPRWCLWPSPRWACSICSLVILGALRFAGRLGGSVLVGVACAVASLAGKVMSTAL